MMVGSFVVGRSSFFHEVGFHTWQNWFKGRLRAISGTLFSCNISMELGPLIWFMRISLFKKVITLNNHSGIIVDGIVDRVHKPTETYNVWGVHVAGAPDMPASKDQTSDGLNPIRAFCLYLDLSQNSWGFYDVHHSQLVGGFNPSEKY